MLNCFHSIRSRFVILIAVAMTMVYGAVAYNQIRETSSRLNDQLERQASLQARVHAETLGDDVWNLNEAAITRQLALLVTHQDIISAEVRETTGLISVTTGRGHIDDGRSADGTFVISHPIRHDSDGIIGDLKLTISRDRVRDENAYLLQTQIQEFLIVALAVVLIVTVTVTSLVRPITRITQTMTRLAEGDLEATIPEVTRQDEIGDMARALEVFKANAEQIRGALDKERELSCLQRQFVSMVSHEFRTPLAVIDANAQRLLRRLEKLDTDRVRVGLGKVRKSVTQLTDLMESVLDAARLEEGRVEFRPEPSALPSLLNELCSSYSEVNGNHQIIVDIDGLPKSTIADRKLLRQIFSNLLSNAIKYSPEALTVWVTGKMHGDDELVISIRDEGLGIPPAELEKLFSRFFRASTSAGIAGTGIGLHLVKHFVDLHEGRVEVESTIDIGTTFSVYLPFIDPAETPLASAA